MDRQLQENVQVIFCILQIGVFFGQDGLEYVVRFCLRLDGFTEFLRAVIDLGEGGVGLGSLEVVLTEHVDVLVDVVRERVGSGFLVVDFLIHHSEVKVDTRDFRMVVSASYLQNAEGAPHVVEAS